MSRSRLMEMTFLAALLMTAPVVHASSIVINGVQLVDPTQPPLTNTNTGNHIVPQQGAAQAPTRSYNISFIRAGGTRPTAVINNQTVSLGDVIAGATVLAIEPGAVTLWIDGQAEKIYTFAGGVRQAPGVQ